MRRTRKPAVEVLHVMTVPQSLRFLSGQLRFLGRRGFRFSVATSPSVVLEEFANLEGIPSHGIEIRRAIAPFRDIYSLVRLVGLIHRLRPDIVHAHTPKAGLLGMLAARMAGTPVRIYHMRGLPFVTSHGLKRKILWLAEWTSCALAHRVICVGPSLADNAILERLCAPEKIRVLCHGSGNGVDAERFSCDAVEMSVRASIRAEHQIPPDSPVVGFVGRLVRDKGIIELAQAWEKVRGELPEAHLLIVGPFEARDSIPESVVQSLKSDPRVHVLGARWDTPPLYSAMDLVVLPSHREGFPNVPLEAAAMKLPVIATRIPGCVDAVIDGSTGALVPLGDIDALARSIVRYLRDADLRLAQGLAGRERVVRDFSPALIWEELGAEYNQLLSYLHVHRAHEPSSTRRKGAAAG